MQRYPLQFLVNICIHISKRGRFGLVDHGRLSWVSHHASRTNSVHNATDLFKLLCRICVVKSQWLCQNCEMHSITSLHFVSSLAFQSLKRLPVPAALHACTAVEDHVKALVSLGSNPFDLLLG